MAVSYSSTWSKSRVGSTRIGPGSMRRRWSLRSSTFTSRASCIATWSPKTSWSILKATYASPTLVCPRPAWIKTMDWQKVSVERPSILHLKSSGTKSMVTLSIGTVSASSCTKCSQVLTHLRLARSYPLSRKWTRFLTKRYQSPRGSQPRLRTCSSKSW